VELICHCYASNEKIKENPMHIKRIRLENM
jgi:hypothetical protein